MKKISNKNKKSKKGFTLIELLAVIIVLAMIMIFAIPSILNVSNEAQKRTFQLNAERVMSEARKYVEMEKMLGHTTTIPQYLATPRIGLGSISSFTACVVYSVNTSNAGEYTLTLYMTNGTYCYSNQTDPTNNEPTVGTTASPCPAQNTYQATGSGDDVTCSIS